MKTLRDNILNNEYYEIVMTRNPSHGVMTQAKS